MKQYTINGRFFAKKLSGQERFAREMIAELDKICKPGEFEIVTPEYAKDIPEYKNIKVIKYGKVKSHFWEQINLWWYLVNAFVSPNCFTKWSTLINGLLSFTRLQPPFQTS